MTDITVSRPVAAGDADTRQTSAPPSSIVTKAPPVALHRRFPLWIAGVVIGFGVAAMIVYLPEAYVQDTDDAYVQADTVPIVPKVAGYVTALHVTDNSHFRAGDLLLEIDPRDFQVAVDSAQANLQTVQAAKVNVERQLEEQSKIVAAAEATIESDRATVRFAGQQLTRYGKLAGDGAGTAERWQQAQSEVTEREAGLQHDLASLAAAQARIGVLQSQAQEADGTIAREEAALAQARLNLSYTRISADREGSVANRIVQVGTFVQPGQLLFSAVPNDSYVIANFKETQLVHMRVGQHVSVRVDALGGQRIDGHIDSFQRGTGANFALLPPENATGNFVKVVQRVPVKILLDGPESALRRIAPGMSVEAEVTIRPIPSWLSPFL
jgi:membrane fusion protein (multidrug efflux system)